MSTITSVRKRCEEPRREGLVMPGVRSLCERPALDRRPPLAGAASTSLGAGQRLDRSRRRRSSSTCIARELLARERERVARRHRAVGSRSLPRGALDRDHALGRPRGVAVDPEDRVQVGVGLLGSSLIAPAPARSAHRPSACVARPRGGARMTSSGAVAAGPQLEAERALGDEHLEAVDGARAMRPWRPRAAAWIRSGRPSRRHTSTHRPDRTSIRVG